MSAPGRPNRLRRGDVLVAAALCSLAELEVLLGGVTRVSCASAAVCTVPLVLRRRLPFVAAAGEFASALLDRRLGPESVVVALARRGQQARDRAPAGRAMGRRTVRRTAAPGGRGATDLGRVAGTRARDERAVGGRRGARPSG